MNRSFLMTSFLCFLIVVDVYHALVSCVNIDLKIVVYIFRFVFIDVFHVNFVNVWMIFVRIINLICNCLTWDYYRSLKFNCISSTLIFVFASIWHSINSILCCILCLRDVLLKCISSQLSTSKRESYVSHHLSHLRYISFDFLQFLFVESLYVRIFTSFTKSMMLVRSLMSSQFFNKSIL